MSLSPLPAMVRACTALIVAGVVLLMNGLLVAQDLDPTLARGEQIYRDSCVQCHGDLGQGVPDIYPDALVGDASVGELTALISETMPEEEPETCVGEDAAAVAEYIHFRFYSEAAQIRNRPPRVGLARLTGEQLRKSLANLYLAGENYPQPVVERGVKAIYFDGARWKNENKKIERVDSVIDFDYGHEGPGEGVSADEFYIYWEGGLKPDVTGLHEIVVHSTCSFVLKFGHGDRKLIDNHVQSGDKTEFRVPVFLTAGQVYSFKIDFIQRKRSTEKPPARIKLAWVPPHQQEQVVPSRNLVPGGFPATFALQAEMPADDRSYGFERGVAINRQWDEATTAAAIEFAQAAVDELWPRYQRRHKDDSDENRAQLRGFLNELAQRAFRGPLSDELRRVYVDMQVDATEDSGEAIKRSLLLILKSPRFLYPSLDSDRTPSQQAANRLALVLHDGLPSDRWLIESANNNKLETPDQVRQAAQRLVNDYRTTAKTIEMLEEWMNLGHFGEISKDTASFPGFDNALTSDLRSSLYAFLEDIVTSENSDYRQLILADWVYTTPRLAQFYGPSWQPADGPFADGQLVGLQRSVSAEGTRFGIVTHPLLLSGLSYHNVTSPVHRGVFLIRFLLGRTLRVPAEAPPPLSPDLHPDMTTRERVELQTSPESCQVCHEKINGLGFVLENFDTVGRYRESEKEKPINAVGTYTARDGSEIKLAGVAELADYLANSDDAQRAFVSRAFQHFVKQPIAAFGADTLDRLTESFRGSQFNIRQLLVEIAVVAATHRQTQELQES